MYKIASRGNVNINKRAGGERKICALFEFSQSGTCSIFKRKCKLKNQSMNSKYENFPDDDIKASSSTYIKIQKMNWTVLN